MASRQGAIFVGYFEGFFGSDPLIFMLLTAYVINSEVKLTQCG
jgi:hypothetical protein